MKKRIALLCLLLACCMTAGALAEGTASGGDDVNFADIIALIADNADKAERLNALNTELDALTEENAALAAAIENLSRQNDQLKRQSAALAGENADLTARLQAAQALNAELSEQLDSAESRIADLTAANAESQEVISLCGEKTDTLTGQLESQKAERDALLAQNNELSEALASAYSQIEVLNSQIAELSSQPEAQTAAAPEENLDAVTDAVFTNARRFVLLLKEHGIEYTYYAPDAEHEEEELSMTVGSTSDSGTRFSYVESVFFDRDNSEAGFRVWNLIDFAAADMNSVRRVCDSLNRSFKWTCFYVDTSDNSVTVSLDVPLLDDPRTTDILWDMLTTVDSIIDSGYDLLKPYYISE